MDWTLETLEALVDLATTKQLSELTFEAADHKVTIKTGATVAMAAVPIPVAPQTSAPKSAEAVKPPAAVESAQTSYYKITSPMVGTFYRSPAPESPMFVEVGTPISAGQTVCIIEAMKLMNELESEVTGTVRKIHVENGSPVEFGQVLMEVDVQ